MDHARRRVTSRRPCSGRRVAVNSVKKLQMREISSQSFSIGEECFNNFHLQEEYDIYDPEEDFPLSLSFLNPRSEIIEVFAIGHVVFALAESGLCAAFSRETKKMICFLNVGHHEVIESLFYNKIDDSLITISVRASDSLKYLICRTTQIEYIRRGEPDAGFRLFESESMRWPGYVEFDDLNGKAITHCAEDKIYKVFDLKNYTLLYSIVDKNIREIKMSPGFLLLIYKKIRWEVPLKIVSIEDGTVLKSFNQLLLTNKKVVIEQFNEKLLVMQENENLQIVDVRNSEVIEVSKTEFLTPNAFIFLYKNQLFLTFTNQTVMLWNLRGELVNSFKDQVLQSPNYNTNDDIYVSNGDVIICYCRANSDESSEGNVGSITISNILTGKCVGKIKASNSRSMAECICRLNCGGSNCNSLKHIKASKIRSTVAEALIDITALSYDEVRNEIYTGNGLGRVHVWAN